MLETLAGDAFALVARARRRRRGLRLRRHRGSGPRVVHGRLRAELRHLSVAEGERGNGVGSALLDAMDAELERRGVEDVEIGVDTANDDAVRLYERPRLQGRLPDLLRLAGQEALGLPRARGSRTEGPAGRRAAGFARRPARRRRRIVSAPRYVSVIGASRATPELAAKAEELGELLAERGCVVVCGGGGGVMDAVARGVKRRAASRSASCRRPIACAPPPTSPTPCAAPWATPATSAWWPAATS